MIVFSRTVTVKLEIVCTYKNRSTSYMFSLIPSLSLTSKYKQIETINYILASMLNSLFNDFKQTN